MNDFGTAVILAGGKSSRMGFDKQLLTLDEKYLFERNADALHTVFDDIVVVTNTPDLYTGCDVRTTTDIYRNAGPLAGLHAAIKAARSHYIYMVACDMPIMNMNFARYLKDHLSSLEERPLVCAPEIDGRIETFNAFYSRDLHDQLEKELQACSSSGKTPGINGFMKKYNINRATVGEGAVRSIDPSLGLFINLNTPEDYERFNNTI